MSTLDRRAPSRERRLPAIAIAVVAAAGLAACGGGSGDGGAATADLGPAEPLSALSPGDPLAPATLPVLAQAEDAGTIDMGDLGGPAVINFWATWCAFCVDEMPDFEQVHQQLGDRVRFIGVDVQDNREAALGFARDVGVTYELVEDVDRSYYYDVKARGMPTTLFVDADGVIRWRHTSALSLQELQALIGEHLGVEAGA